jgi:electron transfer flavoprotein alpha subunit
MSVLIYVDAADGLIKKSSYEALTYGAQLAQKNGWSADAVVLGKITDELPALGKYGVKKVYHIADEKYNQLDARLYTKAIQSVAQTAGAQVIVLSNNLTGKAIGPRLSVALKAGLVAGATGLPDTSNGFVVKKAVFSGKAFSNINIKTAIKIIAVSPNSFSTIAGEGTAEVVSVSGPDASPSVKVTSTQKVTGQVPLGEAELVVSGGRGLKGPENWGMVEELASLIGAATACSRAVADAHWRPHHEHVGQTGGSIAPNLYLAIGISGAIQHLAGVNRSKVIVVINKDPEAPFFKAADYGIVGDAFDVVPKLISEVKKLKGVA